MPDNEALGEIFVKIKADLDELNKDVKQLKGKLDKDAKDMGGSFSDTLKKALFAGGAVAAFRKLLNFSQSAKNAARDFEEIRSKFSVVFGEITKKTEQWANEFGKNVGRSRSDILKWLGTLQDTFVPLGFARDRAAEFSKSLTSLAVDVASFNNAADDDVLRDFTSALVGNTETVRKYGIVITEANTKEEAYRAGLAKRGKELSNAAKVQARMNLIIQGTKDAQGDAIRTANSLANQEKRLSAEYEDTLVKVGNGLVPAYLELTKAGVGWLKIAKLLLGVQDEYNTSIAQQDEFLKGLIGTTKEYREAELGLLQNQLLKTVNQIRALEAVLTVRRQTTGGFVSELLGSNDELKEQIKNLKILKSSLETQIDLTKNFDKEIAKRNNTTNDETDDKTIDVLKAEAKLYEELYYGSQKWYNKSIELIKAQTQELISDGIKKVDALALEKKSLNELAEAYQKVKDVSIISTLEVEQRIKTPGKLGEVKDGEKPEALESKLEQYRELLNEGGPFEGENGFVNAVETSMAAASGFVDGFFEDIRISSEGANSLLEKGFVGLANAFISQVQRMAAEWLAFQALRGGFSLLGLPIPGGAEGGTFVGTNSGVVKLAGGGSFVVPPGFPHDSYPMFVESGEKVKVTPRRQVEREELELQSVNRSIQALNTNVVDILVGSTRESSQPVPVYGEIRNDVIFISNKKGAKIANRIR